MDRTPRRPRWLTEIERVDLAVYAAVAATATPTLDTGMRRSPRPLPRVGVPLHLLAATVAYSRVHTGVHFPGDATLGAVLGTAVAQTATHRLERGAR